MSDRPGFPWRATLWIAAAYFAALLALAVYENAGPDLDVPFTYRLGE